MDENKCKQKNAVQPPDIGWTTFFVGNYYKGICGICQWIMKVYFWRIWAILGGKEGG